MPTPFAWQPAPENEPGAIRVITTGEMDLASVPIVSAMFDSVDHAASLVLDLDRLEFIDAGSAHRLLAYTEAFIDSGRPIAVWPTPRQHERLLKLVGADLLLRLPDRA